MSASSQYRLNRADLLLDKLWPGRAIRVSQAASPPRPISKATVGQNSYINGSEAADCRHIHIMQSSPYWHWGIQGGAGARGIGARGIGERVIGQ